MCNDSLLATAGQSTDIREEQRPAPPAGRFAPDQPPWIGGPDQTHADRYQRIVADCKAMNKLSEESILASYHRAPNEIVLDGYVTSDPMHGEQEGPLSTFTEASTVLYRCM